ncbi:unnamed protein product, partial [Symbiodinium necroappetens]
VHLPPPADRGGSGGLLPGRSFHGGRAGGAPGLGRPSSSELSLRRVLGRLRLGGRLALARAMGERSTCSGGLWAEGRPAKKPV